MADRRRRRITSDESEDDETTERSPGEKVTLSQSESDVSKHDESEYESASDDTLDEDTLDEDTQDDDTVDEDDSADESGSDIIIEDGLDEERQSGDGEEQPKSDKLDDDEDTKNPAYVPRTGAFYCHDQRLSAEEYDKQTDKEKKKLWLDECKWLHDKFVESEQAPKSRVELTSLYGYDILACDKAPDAPPRNQYRGNPRERRNQLSDFVRNDDQRGGYSARRGRGGNRGGYNNRETDYGRDFPDHGRDFPDQGRDFPDRGRGDRGRGNRGGFNDRRGGFNRESPIRNDAPRPLRNDDVTRNNDGVNNEHSNRDQGYNKRGGGNRDVQYNANRDFSSRDQNRDGFKRENDSQDNQLNGDNRGGNSGDNRGDSRGDNWRERGRGDSANTPPRMQRNVDVNRKMFNRGSPKAPPNRDDAPPPRDNAWKDDPLMHAINRGPSKDRSDAPINQPKIIAYTKQDTKENREPDKQRYPDKNIPQESQRYNTKSHETAESYRAGPKKPDKYRSSDRDGDTAGDIGSGIVLTIETGPGKNVDRRSYGKEQKGRAPGNRDMGQDSRYPEDAGYNRDVISQDMRMMSLQDNKMNAPARSGANKPFPPHLAPRLQPKPPDAPPSFTQPTSDEPPIPPQIQVHPKSNTNVPPDPAASQSRPKRYSTQRQRPGTELSYPDAQSNVHMRPVVQQQGYYSAGYPASIYQPPLSEHSQDVPATSDGAPFPPPPTGVPQRMPLSQYAPVLSKTPLSPPITTTQTQRPPGPTQQPTTQIQRGPGPTQQQLAPSYPPSVPTSAPYPISVPTSVHYPSSASSTLSTPQVLSPPHQYTSAPPSIQPQPGMQFFTTPFTIPIQFTPNVQSLPPPTNIPPSQMNQQLTAQMNQQQLASQVASRVNAPVLRQVAPQQPPPPISMKQQQPPPRAIQQQQQQQQLITPRSLQQQSSLPQQHPQQQQHLPPQTGNKNHPDVPTNVPVQRQLSSSLPPQQPPIYQVRPQIQRQITPQIAPRIISQPPPQIQRQGSQISSQTSTPIPPQMQSSQTPIPPQMQSSLIQSQMISSQTGIQPQMQNSQIASQMQNSQMQNSQIASQMLNSQITTPIPPQMQRSQITTPIPPQMLTSLPQPQLNQQIPTSNITMSGSQILQGQQIAPQKMIQITAQGQPIPPQQIPPQGQQHPGSVRQLTSPIPQVQIPLQLAQQIQISGQNPAIPSIAAQVPILAAMPSQVPGMVGQVPMLATQMPPSVTAKGPPPNLDESGLQEVRRGGTTYYSTELQQAHLQKHNTRRPCAPIPIVNPQGTMSPFNYTEPDYYQQVINQRGEVVVQFAYAPNASQLDPEQPEFQSQTYAVDPSQINAPPSDWVNSSGDRMVQFLPSNVNEGQILTIETGSGEMAGSGTYGSPGDISSGTYGSPGSMVNSGTYGPVSEITSSGTYGSPRAIVSSGTYSAHGDMVRARSYGSPDIDSSQYGYGQEYENYGRYDNSEMRTETRDDLENDNHNVEYKHREDVSQNVDYLTGVDRNTQSYVEKDDQPRREFQNEENITNAKENYRGENFVLESTESNENPFKNNEIVYNPREIYSDVQNVDTHSEAHRSKQENYQNQEEIYSSHQSDSHRDEQNYSREPEILPHGYAPDSENLGEKYTSSSTPRAELDQTFSEDESYESDDIYLSDVVPGDAENRDQDTSDSMSDQFEDCADVTDIDLDLNVMNENSFVPVKPSSDDSVSFMTVNDSIDDGSFATARNAESPEVDDDFNSGTVTPTPFGHVISADDFGDDTPVVLTDRQNNDSDVSDIVPVTSTNSSSDVISSLSNVDISTRVESVSTDISELNIQQESTSSEKSADFEENENSVQIVESASVDCDSNNADDECTTHVDNTQSSGDVESSNIDNSVV